MELPLRIGVSISGTCARTAKTTAVEIAAGCGNTIALMYGMLLTFATWLLQKMLAAVLIVLLALAVYAGWLYLQDERVLESERITRLQKAVTSRDELLAAQAALAQKLTTLQADLNTQQDRVQRAADIVAALRQLESWWDRLLGNPAQQTANAEQIQRMESLKSSAVVKMAELRTAAGRILHESESLDLSLSRANAEVARLEASQSKPRQYVFAAWEKTKWWIALALGSYFVGPTLWLLTMYYAVGGLLVRGRAIQLGGEPNALPALSESHVSLEATLQPGELLRVKEKFLQASDEGIKRQTRFVLDWRIPFTSLACGLVELVELQNAETTGTGTYRVTLSNGDDPHLELALVTIPAGASLVLRPSFLVGVMQNGQERLSIRRHWRVFKVQAWVSGQFRFFEFVGPCRLVVSGSRGVRAEVLADRGGTEAPARRTNQDATIGFTPNLKYRPVRAETFWSYYRGMNPLFDDLFSGRGLFVLQETSSEGPAARSGRFWNGVWNGL